MKSYKHIYMSTQIKLAQIFLRIQQNLILIFVKLEEFDSNLYIILDK